MSDEPREETQPEEQEEVEGHLKREPLDELSRSDEGDDVEGHHHLKPHHLKP